MACLMSVANSCHFNSTATGFPISTGRKRSVKIAPWNNSCMHPQLCRRSNSNCPNEFKRSFTLNSTASESGSDHARPRCRSFDDSAAQQQRSLMHLITIFTHSWFHGIQNGVASSIPNISRIVKESTVLLKADGVALKQDQPGLGSFIAQLEREHQQYSKMNYSISMTATSPSEQVIS